MSIMCFGGKGDLMNERDYYAARKGMLEQTPIDLSLLKKLFLHIYKNLEHDLYFQEATGYECVDAEKTFGRWGSDIGAYIYLKLKIGNIWPINKYIDNYDEPTLFTVIEFLHDYVSEPLNKWYHDWNQCGWHSSEYNRDKGKEEYRRRINGILKSYGKGYEISKVGEIREIAPTGLEAVFSEVVETGIKGIDDEIQSAISKFMKYGATIEDKKHAVRSLADVLEFLKKDNTRLQSKDESDLFNIINNFDIRHHNKLQKDEYDKDIFYKWMFYTFISSINMLLKLKE